MELKTLKLANGITLEYAEGGDPSGSTVICLHGYTDSCKSFELVFPLLPPGIHAFAVSLRGHGRSDRPPAGYTPTDLAADVALFIEGLHLGAVVVVGHSMGATIAQRLALDYPRLVKGLLLVGCLADFTANETMRQLQEAVAVLEDPVPAAFAGEFQRSTLMRPIPPRFFETVVSESLQLPARVWKALLAPLMRVNYTKELPALEVPVLLVWGSEDSFATSWDQERLLAAIQGAELVVYTGTGHAVHWEEPGRFARDLEAFVQKAGHLTVASQ